MSESTGKRAAAICLLALAAAALYLCYLISRPFLSPILIAMMLAIVFFPLHMRIQRHIRHPTAAAGLSTILVLFITGIPIMVLGISVTGELGAVVQALREQGGSQGGLSPYLTHLGEDLLNRLGNYINVPQFNLRGALLSWAEQASRYLPSIGAAAVTNLLSFVLDAVVVFFTLFFFLRDGKKIRQELSILLPLSSQQAERLFAGISETMIAHLYGGLAVGVAQGLLTGLCFWALGLSTPILWAVVTALASLFPVIGSVLVWGPAAILLFLNGHWAKALVLLSCGAAVVGQVDVIVRPYVVSARVKAHALLVFFALLGGVEAFGIVGIVVGPVVLSVTLAVLDMLRQTTFSWQSTPENAHGTALNDDGTE